MNKEEIDDWLRYFSNNNQCFMSKDGKIITLFKVFQELKELQYLLKIKNDYIKELQQENKQLKERINKSIDYIENHSLYEEEYDYDYEENSYLSGIDDETAKKDLLEILRGEINE